MKFICEKCRTKYSIADDKVRRKVLKIRCKNCANIIVVRESTREQESEKRAAGGALDAAFDGAFSSSGPRPVPRLGSASSPEMPPDAPILSSGSGLTSLPADGEVHDDEWYLAVDGHQYGPMSFAELTSRVKRGEARSSTGEDVFVWRDGFDDWAEITTVSDLRPYVPPPPPRQRSGLFPVAVVEGQRSDVTGPAPPAAPSPARSGGVPFLTGPQRGVALDGGVAVERPVLATPQPMQVNVPQPSPPEPIMPLATATQTGSGVGTPEASAEFASMMESGLRQLPAGFGNAPMPATAMPVAPQQPAGTPALIKVAAAGGIVSTLTGIAILVYFFAFDRPSKQVVPAPPVAVAPTRAVEAATPPEDEEPSDDESGVAIQFPPMEVERSKTADRDVQSGRSRSSRSTKRPKPAAAPAAQGPKLTKEQQRLLALYGKKSGGAAVPTVGGGARKRGPKRRIGSSDLTRVQRRNSRSLKACYERALKRDDTLANVRVDAELGIGDTGVVRTVRLSGTSSVDLVSCLKRSMRRWVFPAVGAQDIGFPLIFRGSS